MSTELRALVLSGAVRLLRVSYLLDPANRKHVGRTPDGRPTFRRKQELPSEAFATPEEAASVLDRGDRSIVVLSHPWRSAAEPDPEGTTFADLVTYLESDMSRPGVPRDSLLFVDFCSLPQKPRSPEEVETFKAALKCMSLLYASMVTAVVQVKSMPPRPAWMDGRAIALMANVEKVSATAIAQSEGFQRCEDSGDGNVRIFFATHELALQAIASHRGSVPFPLFPEWNDRPYDERGWCIGEQSWAKLLDTRIAHIIWKLSTRGRAVPEEIESARRCRPHKLVEISGGKDCPHNVDVQPLSPAVVAAQLAAAFFTGKGDAAVVLHQMMIFDWLIMTDLKHGVTTGVSQREGGVRWVRMPPLRLPSLQMGRRRGLAELLPEDRLDSAAVVVQDIETAVADGKKTARRLTVGMAARERALEEVAGTSGSGSEGPGVIGRRARQSESFMVSKQL